MCGGGSGGILVVDDDDPEAPPPFKQVVVGICAMDKKSKSKPRKEILTRLQELEFICTVIFPEEVILKEPVEKWPLSD
ncbi:hypothetical protein Pmani_001258 [Petrolisthes manimaculis]|uniref:VIP1 N-terminal domain-containing protein n=1 Tax=Petrolisthes manimaculis TaxID=1843537 RepID=A0AAE1QK11_9EUCA|nr:hypothetical protein Pmani_001258 [Petrolisthes manimaculis]